jgi:hypothetical protein
MRTFLLLAVVGCGDNNAAIAISQPDAPVTQPSVDAPAVSRCTEYPIPIVPSADGEANARAEVSTLSQQANLTWNANTGTISSILGLNLPLPGCVAGVDVASQVFPVLATHAATFNLDLSEWPTTPEPFDCQFADGALVSMGRRTLAWRPFARDIFAYALANIGGVMTLTNVFGTYVPPAPPGLGDAMASCNTLTQPHAIDLALQTQLSASTFELCSPTGTVHYTPQANDGFAFSADETWTWDESEGKVLLVGQRTLRVTLDPSNYTPELLGSAARCPVADPDSDDFTVGFDITFDVQTGAVLSFTPGLDCTVC